MDYKTILAHCNDRRRVDRLLESAVGLSVAFGARLIGLSVTPPIPLIPAGMPGAPDTILFDKLAKTYREQNPAMKAAFEKAAVAQNVKAEWREMDAGTSTVARVVTGQARTVDLVVTLQTASDWTVSLDLDIADRLVLEAGRPVLIIPNRGTHRPVPKRIVVGWTERREAARAVFDALPLLQRADLVTVLEVDSDPAPEAGQNRVALCATLGHHGVTCEVVTAVSRHGYVGDTLLAWCERTRADLLVMGCYGHSRLREFVLGGATRHLLADMTLPVLMSH
jgi:nucleotide-binding universal stress UspA family protein